MVRGSWCVRSKEKREREEGGGKKEKRKKVEKKRYRGSWGDGVRRVKIRRKGW